MHQGGRINAPDSVHTTKLRVGLKYTSSSGVIGTLHVAIHQAEDLPAMDQHGLTNAKVKLYLLPSQSSSSKRKTKVINQNLNPVWDEKFTYKNVFKEDLTTRRFLEVTVWDYDRRGSNGFIGGLRIGPEPESVPDKAMEWMDSSGDEVTHWKAMLDRPGEWVEQWHTLRLSMKPATQPPENETMKSSVTTTKCNLKETSLAVCDVDNSASHLRFTPHKQSSHSDKREPKKASTSTCTEVTREDTSEQKSSQFKDGYDITGRVLMGVYYKRNHLYIHIDRAKELAAADSNGYSDPYIKTYLLLPDGSKHYKQKTGVKKRTLNPIYNETFMVSNDVKCA